MAAKALAEFSVNAIEQFANTHYSKPGLQILRILYLAL